MYPAVLYKIDPDSITLIDKIKNRLDLMEGQVRLSQ
jgi:hypothetical protein